MYGVFKVLHLSRHNTLHTYTFAVFILTCSLSFFKIPLVIALLWTVKDSYIFPFKVYKKSNLNKYFLGPKPIYNFFLTKSLGAEFLGTWTCKRINSFFSFACFLIFCFLLKRPQQAAKSDCLKLVFTHINKLLKNVYIKHEQSVYRTLSTKKKCENKMRNGVFMINIEPFGIAMKHWLLCLIYNVFSRDW